MEERKRGMEERKKRMEERKRGMGERKRKVGERKRKVGERKRRVEERKSYSLKKTSRLSCGVSEQLQGTKMEGALRPAIDFPVLSSMYRKFLSVMKYSLSPDNRCENGVMNMATFLRGFEERGLKNAGPGDQFSKEKKKILFSFCDVCNIQLNSAAQAQVHYDGKSHRKRVKQLSDGQPPPPAQGSGPPPASSCPCPGMNTSTANDQHESVLELSITTSSNIFSFEIGK
ncbi:hypothetical protein STEG23_022281, partial [Scotinomys teguina]